jgi:diacylglycerol kinase family enzyme
MSDFKIELPPAGERVLGLMINPTSRRNRRHLDQIIKIARESPGTHFRITEKPDEVSKGLSELADRSVNVLAIGGGDGTVSRVLTHLLVEKPFETMPVLAILPGGTANMTAGDIGMRGTVLSALRRLRAWIDNDSGLAQLQCRPILRVQSGRDQPASYGFFFGAGAIVQGIEYTNAEIHSRGLKNEFSLGLGLVRSMWGISRQDSRFIKPTDIEIAIDGKPIDTSHNMILMLVSSLERLFLNMRPYWGEVNDKPLHSTMVYSPATRLLRNLPYLLRGKSHRHLSPQSGYVSMNIDRASLVFDGPYTLDGEISHARITTGPVEVSSGGELHFLRL